MDDATDQQLGRDRRRPVQGNPAPATRVTAQFLNTIMDELANVVTNPAGGNAALNPGDNGQVLAAMLTAIDRASPVINLNVGERSVNIGGFIVKAGSMLGAYSEGTVYTPFPSPFPNACWGAFSIARNDSGGTTRDINSQAQGGPTVNGFYTRLNLNGGGTTNSIDGFDWVAFGY